MTTDEQTQSKSSRYGAVPRERNTATPTIAIVVATGGGPAPDQPWETLPVLGRPMVEHVIERLRALGFDRVIFYAAANRARFAAALGSGEQWGLQIRYLRELSPRAIDEILAREGIVTGGDPWKAVRMVPANTIPQLRPSDPLIQLNCWNEYFRLRAAAQDGSLGPLSPVSATESINEPTDY